ncbi:hypothetical protein ACET3X_007030 [Alternaria dauci]|uniref:MYND-type domain-containing protein n=1 Tax=Alternaria dauci TaxID=48095 RepID=A0ABR3UHY6_9PLEO
MTLCDESNNEGALCYGGCSASCYCSKECQKKAWFHHKILCKTFKDFQDRPEAENSGEKYSRAIYFHPDEDAPRFIWLKTKDKMGSDGDSYLGICPGALAAISKKEAESGEFIHMENATIRYNHALARLLPYTLFLSYRENFPHDGSTHNKASDKIVDLSSAHLHDWRGPMIAYGTDVFDDIPHSYDPSYSQDLGPSDLRIVAHWLNTYYFSPENLRTIENLKSELTSVVGVRINCDGDVDIGGRPRYEHIELPAFHYIFQQTATDVSKHISLPIVVQRISGSVEKWQKRLETSPNKFPWVNTAGTFLNIGCKPQLKEISGFDWGLAPLKWQNSVGSVVVMRKDKKELFPEHVHALVEYHQHHLMRFFEEASELHRDKKWVMKQITKEKFQEYYLAWTLRQAENVKVHQISPYDI